MSALPTTSANSIDVLDIHLQNRNCKVISKPEDFCQVSVTEPKSRGDFSDLDIAPLTKTKERVRDAQHTTECILCNLITSSKESLLSYNLCEKHFNIPELLKNNFCVKYKLEANENQEVENEVCIETDNNSRVDEDTKRDLHCIGIPNVPTLQLTFSDFCEKSYNFVSVDDINGDGDSTECYNTETIKEEKISEDFMCTLCQKSYKTHSKLKMHMKIHTGESPFKCTYCEKRFLNKTDSENHERSHTKEKRFICNVCGKALSASSALRTHMKQHTGRPEKCDICNKTFCRKSELTLHMQKHKGDRPYLCTQCGSSFAQRSHLTEHLTMHTDDRPFRCSQCEKSFKKRTLLKQHQALHKGLKNFKCTKCPYACYKKYRLEQHAKIHGVETKTEKKTNVCPVCNKEYTSMSVLNSHVASVHNVIV